MKGITSSVFVILFLSVGIISLQCAKDEPSGRLGIVVPIGDGKVADETPYIITGVYESSPAYNAGIRPDDIIVQIDQVPIQGLKYDYIYRELLLGKAGTTVTIVVQREGKQYVFEVKRGG